VDVDNAVSSGAILVHVTRIGCNETVDVDNAVSSGAALVHVTRIGCNEIDEQLDSV
jgi:hypothetical protein